MAKAFDTWTVLPHKPIEKLADNLWRVSGSMPNGRIQRQMVLVRLADGRVVVHNGIALGEQEMGEIEAWGRPAILFVPNGFHRQDAAIWKQRYAKMTVVTPKASRKRVEQVVPVEMASEEMRLDDTAVFRALPGAPAENVLEVKSGDDTTLILTDAIFNLPKLGGLRGFALGPTGKVAVARIVRWFLVKDRRALAAEFERMGQRPGLRRVLVAHGAPIVDDPAGALRSAAAQIS